MSYYQHENQICTFCVEKRLLLSRLLTCIFLLSCASISAQEYRKSLYERARALDSAGDYVKAVSYYSDAARDGDVAAQLKLGEHYESGLGLVSKNDSSAFYWYKKASKGGKRYKYSRQWAMYHLGVMYEEGRGVTKNYKEAKKHYKKSDLAEGVFRLGLLLLNDGEYEKALDIFSKAQTKAEKYQSSEYRASLMGNILYHRGRLYFLQKALTPAMTQYEKAAKMEYGYNTAAMLELGKINERVYGGVKNYDKAIEWYEMASEHNNAEAQFRLGKMYEDGVGMSHPDWRRAVQLYQQAMRNNYRGNLSGRIDSLSALIDKERDAKAQRRIAFVVGNGGYHLNKYTLAKPTQDATALAKVLKKLNYKVIQQNNTSKEQLEKLINDFCGKTEGYDVALFYYAGHGFQVNGKNYMIPTDADHMDDDYESVEMGRLTKCMDGVGIKIIIIDACRVKSQNYTSTLYGAGSVPPGTFVAYAAQPGQPSLEGSPQSKNAPYMTAVLRMLEKPGLNITDFFAGVKDYVIKETAGAQIPTTYNCLNDDGFMLNPYTDNNK